MSVDHGRVNATGPLFCIIILEDGWTGVIMISDEKNSTNYMCGFMTGRIREPTRSI